MKVIFEPKIKEHDPALYQSEKIASVVQGWDALSNDALSHYEEEGYIIVTNAFTDSEIKLAKDELSAMTLSNDPKCDSIYYEGSIRDAISLDTDSARKGRENDKGLDKLAMGIISTELPQLEASLRARYVRKFMGFTGQHPLLNDLASKPEMLSFIKKLCKVKDVELFQEMAMIKPPGGREKPWHQDHAYFNYPLDTCIVGVWIALGDVDQRNGCMFLLPGEHKNGPILHFMKRDWQICDSDIYTMLAGKRVAAPMKAGDVLIFDSKLPHGTPKNITDSYRWAVQLHFKGTKSSSCSNEYRMELFGSEGKNVSC